MSKSIEMFPATERPIYWLQLDRECLMQALVEERSSCKLMCLSDLQKIVIAALDLKYSEKMRWYSVSETQG